MDLAYRRDKAKIILEDEIVKEALKSMKNAIFINWENCKIQDKDTQHELKLMLKMLKDFEKNLENFISEGNQAEIEIERKRRWI